MSGFTIQGWVRTIGYPAIFFEKQDESLKNPMSTDRDLNDLSEFAVQLRAESLPMHVQEKARACLLNGLAVGIGTIHARSALAAAQAMDLDEPAGGCATRFLDGKKTSSAHAAFANAALLSGRVQGDSHPCGHLGGVVLPAALAVAERSNASGEELLSAIIAGYEVALRIGRDHAADLSARGFRTTPCYGVLAAAVTAGRLMRFDGEGIANAIRLAVNFSGGLREYVDAGTGESPFQAAFAAKNGIHAAALVRCGTTAAPSALDGTAGFYRAFASKGVDYGRRLLEGLGTDYEFTTITYKQYPVCQFLRGVIRGLSILRQQVEPASAARLEITMNPFEADFIGIRYAGPFTTFPQTVMSAPFCAALAWTTGTATYAGLHDFTDARVLELIPGIDVISDPACKRYAPRLKVTMGDGKTLEWEDTSGEESYRLTWPDAVDMIHQLTDEVGIPRPFAEDLAAKVGMVGRSTSVAPVIESLRSAVAAAPVR